jgi:protein phosphatase 1G
MGAYLSSPVTTKEVWEGRGSDVKYGGSAMQGWRRTMEDAHLAETAVDANTQLFGVFDGHGGAEVAMFCKRYMVAEIKSLKEFDDAATVEDALVRVFHRMDEMLREPQYSVEIEGLKTKEAPEDGEDGGDGDGGTMDALDLLKRVFQLKRFMGQGGEGQGADGQAALPGSGSAAGSGAAAPAPKPVTSAADTEETMVQAGCTAVVAIKRGNDLFVANAGDSRGVMGRAGKAIALSEDHKPAHEIERTRIIAAGGFLSDIGGVCRVNGNLNLSRAIGDLRYKCNAAVGACRRHACAQSMRARSACTHHPLAQPLSHTPT